MKVRIVLITLFIDASTFINLIKLIAGNDGQNHGDGDGDDIDHCQLCELSSNKDKAARLKEEVFYYGIGKYGFVTKGNSEKKRVCSVICIRLPTALSQLWVA